MPSIPLGLWRFDVLMASAESGGRKQKIALRLRLIEGRFAKLERVIRQPKKKGVAPRCRGRPWHDLHAASQRQRDDEEEPIKRSRPEQAPQENRKVLPFAEFGVGDMVSLAVADLMVVVGHAIPFSREDVLSRRLQVFASRRGAWRNVQRECA